MDSQEGSDQLSGYSTNKDLCGQSHGQVHIMDSKLQSSIGIYVYSGYQTYEQAARLSQTSIILVPKLPTQTPVQCSSRDVEKSKSKKKSRAEA